jgi:thiamine-phosphate pyrophosphorylase
VYVILNHPAHCPGAVWELGRACLEAGAGLLQFRAKQALSLPEMDELRTLTERSSEAGVPLLINDRLDLVREVGAAGVHLGQSDAPVAAARADLGAGAIVGATTPTVDLAVRAERDGASYVAVGAMYPSPTKPDKPVLGPARLCEVAQAVTVPVCAIGGITAARAPELLDAGADLLCVISAVGSAPDPRQAVRDLVAACDAYLR